MINTLNDLIAVFAGEAFGVEGEVNATELSLKLLDADDLIDGLSHIEVEDVFPELARPHLSEVQHVIDQKREYLCAGCLYLDAIGLLLNEISQLFLQVPQRAA